MSTNRLALTGVAAALVYTGAVVLGGAITPGYSHTGQHVAPSSSRGPRTTWSWCGSSSSTTR
jgi:hypothetical protein